MLLEKWAMFDFTKCIRRSGPSKFEGWLEVAGIAQSLIVSQVEHLKQELTLFEF